MAGLHADHVPLFPAHPQYGLQSVAQVLEHHVYE